MRWRNLLFGLADGMRQRAQLKRDTNWEPGNGGGDQNNGFKWFTIKLPIRPRQTSEGTRASEKLSRFAPLMRTVLDDPQHKAISEKVLSLTTNAEFYLDGEITSFEGLCVV